MDGVSWGHEVLTLGQHRASDTYELLFALQRGSANQLGYVATKKGK